MSASTTGVVVVVASTPHGATFVRRAGLGPSQPHSGFQKMGTNTISRVKLKVQQRRPTRDVAVAAAVSAVAADNDDAAADDDVSAADSSGGRCGCGGCGGGGGGGFAAGCGSADVTGPIDGVGLMGYAMPLQTSAGLWQRLWARAFIIATSSDESGKPDPSATVAVVVVDACMTFPDLKVGRCRLTASQPVLTAQRAWFHARLKLKCE